MIWSSLALHDETFSGDELIFNSDIFPHLESGSLVEVVFREPFAAQRKKDGIILPLILKAIAMEGKQSPTISISRSIGETFEVSARREVSLKVIKQPIEFRVSFVEVFFRDQYISRGGLWNLKTKNLNGACVYLGKKVEFNGAYKVRIDKINVNGNDEALSGYVDEETKIVYRSESAKFFVFLQMSQEIMDIDANENVLYEKALYGFFPDLFNRWNGANHVVSIILFTRILFHPTDYQRYKVEGESFSFDRAGRPFKDFYHVVLDWETRIDWSDMMPVLKKETESFMANIIERNNLTSKWAIDGYPSKASDGNFLETINLALNMFDRHYIDRDLTRTGLSIMIVTPSNGVFKVSRSLLRLTKQRMIDNGIGMDMVCLGSVPLFSVPLFDVYDEKATPADPGFMEQNSKWRFPHWVECSFYDIPNMFLNQRFPSRDNQSAARCSLNLISQLLDLDVMSVIQQVPTIEESFNEIYASGIMIKRSSMTTIHNNLSHESLSGASHINREIDYELFDGALLKSDSYSSPKPVGGTPSLGSRFTFNKASLEDVRMYNGSTASLRKVSNVIDRAGENNLNGEVSSGGSRHRGSLESNKAAIKPSDSANRNTGSVAIPISRVKISSGIVSKSLQNNNFSSKSSSPARSVQYIGNKGSNDVSPNKTPPKFGSHVIIGSLAAKSSWNPTNPYQQKLKMSNYRSRWNYVYLKPIDPANPLPRMNWKSISSPACLPLVTSYFPSPEELREKYREYCYTLYPNDDNIFMEGISNSSEQHLLSLLLRELLIQRLSQGYQFVLHDSIEGAMDKDPMELFQSKNASTFKTYYLSLGHHYHKLTNTGSHVDVRRYVRNDDNRVLPSESYTYHVANYNWNYSDHLVFGYEDELIESLKFWRTRLILIPLKNIPKNSPFLSYNKEPGESLSDEEVRIMGFVRFVEVFRKCELNSNYSSKGTKTGISLNSKSSEEAEKKRLQITSDLNIVLSTFRLSVFVKGEEAKGMEVPLKSSRKSGSLRLLQETNFGVVIQSIQNPNDGIPVKDRRWHWRMYHKVFIGSDFVDWLIKTFDDVDTRDDAVAYANRLLDAGLIEHVSHTRKFMDGHYFYRINDSKGKDSCSSDAEESTVGPIRWFRQKLGGQPSNEITTKSQSSLETNSVSGTGQVVQCSRKIFIDIESNKKAEAEKDRVEWAIIHYDSAHNPSICYHIHVNWLVCNSRSMDDLFQSWARRAYQCGFNLVEAPIEADVLFNDFDPFHSPMKIPLSVYPPGIAEIQTFLRECYGDSSGSLVLPSTYFLEELLKARFDFVLDLESDDNFSPEINLKYTYKKIPTKYTQYVHRSGAAFVQVVAEPDSNPYFLWSENRLFMSRKRRFAGAGSATIDQEVNGVRDELVKLCSDYDRLRSFWNEITKNLTTESGLDSIADDAVVESTSVLRPTATIQRTPSNQSVDSSSRRKSVSSLTPNRSQNNKKSEAMTTIVGFVIPEKEKEMDER